MLLSSKMNKAVDVVVEKLKPHLGSLTVILRGGDRRYRDELKKFLDNLFDGTGAPPKPRPGEIEMLEERLRAADAELARPRRRDSRDLLELEARWTQHVAAAPARSAPPAYNEDAAAALGPEALRRGTRSCTGSTPASMPVVGWLAGRKREQMPPTMAPRSLASTSATWPHLEADRAARAARAQLARLERELVGHDDINALLDPPCAPACRSRRAGRRVAVGAAARGAGRGAAAEPAHAGALQDGAGGAQHRRAGQDLRRTGFRARCSTPSRSGRRPTRMPPRCCRSTARCSTW